MVSGFYFTEFIFAAHILIGFKSDDELSCEGQESRMWNPVILNIRMNYFRPIFLTQQCLKFSIICIWLIGSGCWKNCKPWVRYWMIPVKWIIWLLLGIDFFLLFEEKLFHNDFIPRNSSYSNFIPSPLPPSTHPPQI